MMSQAAYSRLDKLFKNAHAIAYESQPLTAVNWISKLDKSKGLEMGDSYKNDKSCRVMISIIASIERRKITALLEQAKFVTVLSDGSTDVSVIENEIIYIRFSIKGHVYVFFLALIAVDKADARGIITAIKNGLLYVSSGEENLQTLLSKLVAYCCDGASVNTGHINGVIALMRNEIHSQILLIHCLVHRLELGYKDAIKGIKVYDKLVTALSSMFAFYHVSPLQRTNLKNTFEAIGKKLLLPLRVGGTRWLAHTGLALENLFTGYEGYVVHLGQVKIINYYAMNFFGTVYF